MAVLGRVVDASAHCVQDAIGVVVWGSSQCDIKSGMVHGRSALHLPRADVQHKHSCRVHWVATCTAARASVTGGRHSWQPFESWKLYQSTTNHAAYAPVCAGLLGCCNTLCSTNLHLGAGPCVACVGILEKCVLVYCSISECVICTGGQRLS